MFYINRNLRTQLFFEHYDMDKLHSDEQVLRKLKEKVEGRCHPQYGYIIQITKTSGSDTPCGIDISVPAVENNSCKVVVIFSAITFKPQKKDILDIFVTELSEEFIKGRIGHAEVMIPQSKMPKNCCEYRGSQNIYILRDLSTSEETKIDKDSKLRCRVLEIKTELNFQMKIIGEVEESFIPTLTSY